MFRVAIRLNFHFPLLQLHHTDDDMSFGYSDLHNQTTFPPSKRSHETYYWTLERLLSVGLVPLAAAAFVTSGSPMTLFDGLLGISLIIHSHIRVRFLTTPPLFHFLAYFAGGI
jgi:hypothetical protein